LPLGRLEACIHSSVKCSTNEWFFNYTLVVYDIKQTIVVYSILHVLSV